VVDSGGHTQSDRAGQYRLEGAPPGPFTLRAEKEGFRVRMLSGLRVDPRATLTQDVTLHAIDGGATLEFAGVGANLAQTPAGFAFNGVFPGGPADRAGLRAGDRIVAIDGESTDGMSIADALQHLRGVAGTSVGVSVQHATSSETVDVMVERADVVR
jgi:C-terminal processing protease CtpA/Prc